MELEVRTKDGEMIAKYLGHMAAVNFEKLMNSTNLFTMTTKKLKNKPELDAKEFLCFVATEYCKLGITDEFELWFAPGDYIKVIN